MKGRAIEQRARDIAADPDAVHWTAALVARAINAACLYIADRRPDSCAITVSMPLAAGSLQTVAGLARPGLRLLGVPCNTNGRSVTPVAAADLDAIDRNWRKALTSAVIKHFVPVEQDPRAFYTYPPARDGATLDVIYLPVPVQIQPGDLDAVELSLLDTFLEAAAMHVLGTMYLQESAVGKAELAAGYIARCDALLGVGRAAAPAQGAA